MPSTEVTASIFPNEYVSEIASVGSPTAAEQVDKIRDAFEETAKADYGKSKPYRIVTRAKIVE